jgi:uncharacterized protein with HEPN domain
MDLTAFTEDLKTTNAVERCLERISEAARKLGGAAEALCPAIPRPNCAPSEISCGTNTTESTSFASW